MNKNELLAGMAKIAREAGRAILDVYESADFEIESKADDSPLTAADLAAHNLIVAGLAELAPDIPVLSEESHGISFDDRSGWSRYFLVDPLDGTKEFINRNGEFTVNIALIEQHQPTLGAVYVPVQDKLYLGDVEAGVATRTIGDQSEPIRVRALDNDKIMVVASRRHGSDALVSLMARLADQYKVETENVGSSLKFCLIAEGKADFYPRFAPTSEWDTGAAQALVVAAGGAVVNLEFEPLSYNAKENILNPHFVVFGDTSKNWRDIMGSRGQ
jgi:3'(2'), 5'-bisphosphate nucleotidase